MSHRRRTFIKTAGALGAASIIPGAASATKTIDTELDTDGGFQEVLVVFENRSRMKTALEVFDFQYHVFSELPIAYARLTGEQIATLAELDGVRKVAANRELEYHNDESRASTRADEVQDELGYTGEGVHAVVIDSGIDGTHPDFQGRIRHNYRYVEPVGDEATWVDAGENAMTDDYGHGTHCSGTLAGDGSASDGEFAGMAPDTELTVYSSGAAVAVLQAVAAYNHVLANHPDANLISNSYGISNGDDFDPDDPLNVAAFEAFQEGNLSLFSAGNSGPETNTLNVYAKAPYNIGVAATDPQQRVTDFSSRGREPGEGGPEGANYDRQEAFENFLALQSAGEPAETERFDEFDASGAVGGAGVVGLTQTTDTFGVEEQADDDYELTVDTHRIEAELTWEPSNPEGTEPSSFEVALEDADGNEVTSSDGDGFSTGEENRRTLAANVEPGTYQFSVTGWRGAAEWDLTADIQVAELGDDTVEGPFGLYRNGVGAPGDAVMSTFNPGHALQALNPNTEPFYGRISGTSMSCPGVAGICALVYEAHEDEFGEYPRPFDVIEWVEASANFDEDLGHTPANIGAGFVDAVGAVELAQQRDEEEDDSEGELEVPDLEPIPNQEENAGDTVRFDAIVANTDDVSLFVDVSELPDDADVEFTDNGDGTGEFVWETEPGDNGDSPYTVTVTATNDAGNDSQAVEIAVEPPQGNPNE